MDLRGGGVCGVAAEFWRLVAATKQAWREGHHRGLLAGGPGRSSDLPVPSDAADPAPGRILGPHCAQDPLARPLAQLADLRDRGDAELEPKHPAVKFVLGDWNEGDFGEARKHIAPDIEIYTNGLSFSSEHGGPAMVKESIESWRALAPDVRMELSQEIREKDRIAIEFRITAARGPLRAMRRQRQRSSCAIWSRTAVTASISAGSCPGATSTP